MTLFESANYCEAGIWVLIGICFATTGLRRSNDARRRCMLLATAFVAFGLSDVVEARTGAWWRPRWLFAWKGACLAVLAWQLIAYIHRKKRAETPEEP